MLCRRAFVFLAFLGAAGSLAAQEITTQKVEVDYDHSADFSSYRTYGWTPFQTPAANPATHIRLTQSIERELLAHGLTKAENAAAADLLVQYEGRLEKKVRGTPSRTDGYWQPTNPRFIVNFDRVEVGTLVISLWDPKKKDVVWHGRGTTQMGKEDERPRQADEAVTKILAEYPPKPEESPTPKP
jgi:hypothetical protein